jgi:hypothetical protein
MPHATYSFIKKYSILASSYEMKREKRNIKMEK